MKTLMILALALSLTGTAHAGWFLEDYSDVNDKISQYNESNKTNAANALVACGSDAACKVGVMAIFFSNNGQQFFKPESWKDVLLAFYPYADLTARTVQNFRSGTNGDSAGFIVPGNGNTFIGVGNKTTADRHSSASTSIAADYVRTENHNNRTYSLGGEKGQVSDEVVTTYVPENNDVK